MPAPKSYTSCAVSGCNVNLKNDGKTSSKLGTCLRHRSEMAIHVDGESFRYCQQCVKLHPLSEFDGKKRGCRQRLADHNMRRQRNNLAKRKAAELTAPPQGPSLSAAEASNAPSSSCANEKISPSPSHVRKASPSAGRAESEGWSASGTHPCETMASYDSHQDSYASALKESASILPPEDLRLLEALDWACGIHPEQGNKQRLPRLSSPQMQSETISVNFGVSQDQAPLFPTQTFNTADPYFDMPCVDMLPMGNSGVYSSLIQDSSMSAAFGTGTSAYHMSMKINDATPANLPHGLAQNLLGLHSVGPLDMQGAIRPGCVHLGVEFTMPSAAQRNSSAEAFVRNLLTAVSTDSDMPWCKFDTDIFLHNSIIKIRDAGANISISRNPMRPVIKSVSAIAAATGEIVLEVVNLELSAVKALCRVHGEYHELEVAALERRGDGKAIITALLPEDVSGLALLEVDQETAAGMVVSFPEAMLITNDEEVAEELTNGLRNRPREQVESVLRDFAAAMHSKDEPSLACFRSAALTATALGLPLTLQEIVESASMHAISPSQVVMAANWEPEPGALLRQAVLSGSLETVIAVLMMLQDLGIEAGLCKPQHATGITALHLAGLLGHKEMLSLFAESCPAEFAQGFPYLPGGPHGLTPRQMFIHRHVLLPQPPEPLAAVQGQQEEEESSYIAEDMVPGNSRPWNSSSMLSSWSWSTAVYSFICVNTAAILYASVSYGFLDCNWAIAMLPISLAVILFCRFWHSFSRYRLHSICSSAGFQLSDTLKPLDPSVASAYNDFKATHWYMPSWMAFHTAFFGGLMFLTMINAYFKKAVFSINAVMITMAMVYAVYKIRRHQHKRKSSYGIEVVNVIEDTLVYFSFFLPSFISYMNSVDEISPHGLLSLTSSQFKFVSASLFYSFAQSLVQGGMFPMPLGIVLPVRFFHMLITTGTTFLWQMNLRVAGAGGIPLMSEVFMVSQILGNAIHYVCLYEAEIWAMKEFVTRQISGKKKV